MSGLRAPETRTIAKPRHFAVVWRAIESVPEASGGAVWCWADYRHRNGFTNDFPTFFGPFGIVTFDRHPKKAHAALRALWTGGDGAAAR